MENNRERRNKIGANLSRLLMALALVILFSSPGGAAIKRFTDEQGTLHISNEGGEGKPPLTISTPPGRPPRGRGPQAFPGAAPPAPLPPPRVEPPEPEDVPEDPDPVEEEPVEEPAPPPGGPR